MKINSSVGGIFMVWGVWQSNAYDGEASQDKVLGRSMGTALGILWDNCEHLKHPVPPQSFPAKRC